MDLNKLLTFKAIAETGSISGATAIVHLSQPAISLQLQSLEQDLGLKLFERSNRGLILTSEGEMLKARVILLEEWMIETNDLLSGLNSYSGKIKIGTYTTASSYLLSPKLSVLFENYPEIELSYSYLNSDEIIRKVKNLELDCAILSDMPEVEGMEIIPFYDNELILVCSTKNKIIPSEIIKEDLGKYPFLSYPLKNDYCYREVDRKFGRYLRHAPKPIESESFDTLKQSLINDLGISFMPEYLIRQELKEKKLKQIKVKAPALPIRFSIITKKGKILSRKMEAFRDFLLENY